MIGYVANEKVCNENFLHSYISIQKNLLVYFWPETKGAKCLIENNGKFLLVRISYGHREWTIPGGGVKKDEAFKVAARREAYEEVGIQVGNLKKIFEYKQNIEYKRDNVKVYYAKVTSPQFKIDETEIAEAGWFSPHELPTNRRPSLDKIFNHIP